MQTKLLATTAFAAVLFTLQVFDVRLLQPGTLLALDQQRGTLPAFGACFHDSQSSADNQDRKAAAQALARAINDAQSRAVSAQGRYLELANLPKLPAVPRGFDLRFYTDGNGYVASLKDTYDPCRYGLFTDQQARLYESSPQVPQLAN